jgi:tRNA pseudouridine38-40 synthase
VCRLNRVLSTQAQGVLSLGFFLLRPSMRTFKLTLSYDGTAYSGWQYQPDRPTVQGTLEAALLSITQESIRVAGSGRTDAGVHAVGQVVSFQTDSRLSPAVLQKALNAMLPEDMVVVELRVASDRFHAIRDCVRKRYRYVLHDGPTRAVFERRYAWHVWRRLDEVAMQRAAEAFVGTHDFASFETQGTPRESTVRTVYELCVTRIATDNASQSPGSVLPGLERDVGLDRRVDSECIARAGQGGATLPAGDIVHIEIEANGFLYNMVRTIVGTLVQVGRGQRDPSWPAVVLAARDRRLAGMTAPPQGLFLLTATYRD